MPTLQLTFDDGPGPSTPALLDVLATAGVRATFFVLGAHVERAREICVRAAREGHELGNHTYSHARPDAIDAATLAEEIAKTDELILDVWHEAGVTPAPIRVRLPYGVVGEDPRVAMLAAIGRTHVGWTAAFGDWSPSEPTELAARMRAHVVAQHAAGDDAIIDLHDSSRTGVERPATVEAVRLFLAR